MHSCTYKQTCLYTQQATHTHTYIQRTHAPTFSPSLLCRARLLGCGVLLPIYITQTDTYSAHTSPPSLPSCLAVPACLGAVYSSPRVNKSCKSFAAKKRRWRGSRSTCEGDGNYDGKKGIKCSALSIRCSPLSKGAVHCQTGTWKTH